MNRKPLMNSGVFLTSTDLLFVCVLKSSRQIDLFVVVYLAIIKCGNKLIGSQGELRPLVEVHPAANVVQMLEVEGWHLRRERKQLNFSTIVSF